jgi:hypothetical protein
VDRYSFLVELFHFLLHAGLSRRTAENFHTSLHNNLQKHSLQIASQNITRSTSRLDSPIMHSMTVIGEGGKLAPEKEICEPGDGITAFPVPLRPTL